MKYSESSLSGDLLPSSILFTALNTKVCAKKNSRSVSRKKSLKILPVFIKIDCCECPSHGAPTDVEVAAQFQIMRPGHGVELR